MDTISNNIKRVAVCFSGQPRTWKKCIDSWHNILLQHGRSEHVDVFCHVWNFNTVSNALGNSAPTSEIVNQSELEELIDFLKPKKFCIEPEKIFVPENPNQALQTSSWISQFYGINQASKLKQSYEIENNFLYDVVVRARYDSFYETNISDIYDNVKPNTMHGFHYGWNSETGRGRMGDICWVSESSTYNAIADYYLNLQCIDKKWHPENIPEEIFFHYIKKTNSSIENNHWNIKIMRPSQELSYTKHKEGYETW